MGMDDDVVENLFFLSCSLSEKYLEMESMTQESDITVGQLQEAFKAAKLRKQETKEGTAKAMKAFVGFLTGEKEDDGGEASEFKKILTEIVDSGRFSPSDIKRLMEAKEKANGGPPELSQAKIEQEKSRLKILTEEKERVLGRQMGIAQRMQQVERDYEAGVITEVELEKYADIFAEELVQVETGDDGVKKDKGIDLAVFFGGKK